MAAQNTYLLEELEAYARQNFPQAHKIIVDVDSYKLERSSIKLHYTITPEIELLHVAYWDFKFLKTPYWASILGSDNIVQYYRGKKGSIEATDAPYPNVGKSEVQAYLPPFRLVAPRKWPKSGVKRDNARTESRERLAVLVKFAFLLTGRIHRVTSDDVGDQLSKFGELCAFIEDTKQAQDQHTQRKEKDKEAENAEEDESTDGSTTDTTDASSADFAVPVRSSKRVASSPESNGGVYAEPAVDERMTRASKRRKSSRLQSGTLSSAKVPFETMCERLRTVFEQYKMEEANAKAQEEHASGQEIETLKRQLAEQKKEAQVWKKKAQEWKGKYDEVDAVLQPIISMKRK